jgi:hypothetical protein
VFASKSSQQSVVDPKSNSIDPASKQSRVIAMLQSPAGTTIASMMEVAWLPGRCGAQAPQAEARIEKSRGHSRLSDYEQQQPQVRA